MFDVYSSMHYWPDYAQGSRAKRGASVREGHSGCPFLIGAPVCHPSPRIRVGTVCAEAGREAIISSFEPAKALVRGLPLPRPPSFRDHLGCLPVLWPVGHPRCMGEHGATSDRLVAKGGDTSGEEGGLPAQHMASCAATGATGSVRQNPFQGHSCTSPAPCGPHGCRGPSLTVRGFTEATKGSTPSSTHVSFFLIRLSTVSPLIFQSVAS